LTHLPDLIEIAVEVAGIDCETAADLFRQVCPDGIAIEPGSRLDPMTDTYVVDGDARAVVKGYLRAGPESVRVRRSLRLALAMAPLQAAPRWRRPRRLREEDWRDSWKRHFGVQKIGRALVVKPSWVRHTPRGGDVVIEIDPGMAFGTGQHPTTAMCLGALEEMVTPDATVLDLGCGSGILAIASAKLGATRVVALDIDPQAVRATEANGAVNGVSGIIEVSEGTLAMDDASDARFTIIVANISGLTLERLAPAFARALARRGALIASGFLEDAVDGLSGAFVEAGLRVERVIEEGVWRAITAVKHEA